MICRSVYPLDQASNCRANCRFVSRNAPSERGNEAKASALDLGRQFGRGFAPDHAVEFSDDLSTLDQGVGTPASTAATVTVSAFESVARGTVIRRAIVLADGIR